MTVCQRTGITVPECSCSSCLRGQIELHMPTLLSRDPGWGHLKRALVDPPPAPAPQPKRRAA